jgi:hypothetical protein
MLSTEQPNSNPLHRLARFLTKKAAAMMFNLEEDEIFDDLPPLTANSTTGDSNIAIGASWFNELTYHQLSLRQYLNQTPVQKYKMPILVQWHQRSFSPQAFRSIARTSFRTPHGTVDNMRLLLFLVLSIAR